MRPAAALSALTHDAALAVAGIVKARRHPAAPAPLRPRGASPATPVVLVHGYGGTRSTWSPLQHRLSAAGCTGLHTTTYTPFAPCVATIARALVRECHEAMERAGTDRVSLVGHSLGGVVVRYAVQELGLEPHVRTAVTVAAPHRGTRAALLGRGTLVASLRPGSPLLEELRRRARPSSVRWVSYYSDADLVVRPRSSRLDEPGLGATNVLVPGAGHLGIVRSPRFLTSAVDLLTREPPHPAGLPAAA
jgi:predicted alpha/beta hydrolase family esterase